jgi:hypothetical protein
MRTVLEGAVPQGIEFASGSFCFFVRSNELTFEGFYGGIEVFILSCELMDELFSLIEFFLRHGLDRRSGLEGRETDGVLLEFIAESRSHCGQSFQQGRILNSKGFLFALGLLEIQLEQLEGSEGVFRRTIETVD